MKLYFNSEDASQIAIGAFSLAMPIAFSQEAWDMAISLPWYNILLLAVLSIFFLSHYTYFSLFQGIVRHRISSYIIRVALAYMITLLVVILVLLALDKFPLLTEPLTALKRMLIIAMPASMGGIIVDSMDKE